MNDASAKRINDLVVASLAAGWGVPFEDVASMLNHKHTGTRGRIVGYAPPIAPTGSDNREFRDKKFKSR